MIDPLLVLALYDGTADDDDRDLAIQALAAQVTDERRRYEALQAQHSEAMAYLNEKDSEVERLLIMLSVATDDAMTARRLLQEQTQNVMALGSIAYRAGRWAARWKRAAKRKRHVANDLLEEVIELQDKHADLTLDRLAAESITQ